MRAIHRGIVALTLLSAGGGVAWSQERASEVPAAGFWPTPRMIDFGINRMTEEMAKVYDLTEDQVWLTREVIKSKFPAWMQANRAEMQTLMNDYFEGLIADEPPTPDQVAAWSQRVIPLFEEFNVLMEESAEEFKTFMTDDQVVILNGQMAAVRVGMNMAQQRMEIWADGGYDPDTEWVRSPQFRETERERRRELEREQRVAQLVEEGLPESEARAQVYAGAAPGAGPTPEDRNVRPATPGGAKDEWDKYVEDFIQRYELDQAQANRALSFLEDAKRSRDSYLRIKAGDIQRLQERLSAADSPEAKERIGKDLEKVREPIDGFFARFKDRLERLPTRAQRAKAEEREKSRETGGEASAGERAAGSARRTEQSNR